MENIMEIIRKRRSVRTFDGCELDVDTKDKLCSFMENVENPFGIPVSINLLNAKEYGLNCPVVSGTDLYVGGKVACGPKANVAFGYSFEMLVLYAQSFNIGTVWIGGTMNRPAYEQAMELAENEMMPCASPLGYVAKKMSLRETMMRKAIKADERFAFEELFFDTTFEKPLTKEKAGIFEQPLEMVRLAPSAVNKQPWRVVVDGDAVHFYLKRSKGFSGESTLDMQKIDMGIALCHFALTAKEIGLEMNFVEADPKIEIESGMEYIASYKRAQ